MLGLIHNYFSLEMRAAPRLIFRRPSATSFGVFGPLVVLANIWGFDYFLLYHIMGINYNRMLHLNSKQTMAKLQDLGLSLKFRLDLKQFKSWIDIFRPLITLRTTWASIEIGCWTWALHRRINFKHIIGFWFLLIQL